jgi:hypothetical protein
MADKFTRPQDDMTESRPEWFPRGGEPAVIDHSDGSTLLAAFKGTEVAIPAIAFNALKKQKGLAKATKAAGGKLFVLTGCSIPSDHTTTGVLLTNTHLNT